MWLALREASAANIGSPADVSPLRRGKRDQSHIVQRCADVAFPSPAQRGKVAEGRKGANIGAVALADAIAERIVAVQEFVLARPAQLVGLARAGVVLMRSGDRSVKRFSGDVIPGVFGCGRPVGRCALGDHMAASSPRKRATSGARASR